MERFVVTVLFLVDLYFYVLTYILVLLLCRFFERKIQYPQNTQVGNLIWDTCRFNVFDVQLQ